MESMGGNIVGGADDFEIEVETRKQPKVRNDVLEKWNSMTDVEKEPYIAQSKIDSEEYKEWRKTHEKNEVSTRCNIKRVNSLIIHLKEKGQLNVLGEMGFGSLVGVRDRPIRRELCQYLMAQFDVKQCIAKYVDFSFPLGIPCAAAVLGVGNEGKSVIEVSKSKNWKALASKYGLKQKVTYAELEEEIKSGSYGGDELKARVLLYLIGIFLCPTGDTSTNKDYMKLICDEGLKGEFNWTEYVHSRLIESIITFKKGSQRYLKGYIAILEVVLFDFWSGSEAVPAYERIGVARIRVWGKEEVVRVMAKLKLNIPRKQERDVVEAVEKKKEMVVLGDYGEGDDGEGKQSKFEILMSELTDIKKIQFDIMQRQSRVEEKLERVKETLERHKGEVEGKIDGVVKEVEVLKGEVVKEVEVLRGELKMVRGEKIDGVMKEVVELRSELTGMKSYVEQKYNELNKYEEEKREEEEKMKEMRRKDVDVIYTPESVIDADLDSECLAPQKKKQKVEKTDIPSGIDDIEAVICDYLWNSRLESGMLQFEKVTPEDWLPSISLSATDVGCQQQNHVATIYDSLFTFEAAKQRVNDAKRLACMKGHYHKKNEQLNGYDCDMYVMMWMESIGSTGATGDFAEENSSSPMNTSVIITVTIRYSASTPKMAPKRQRQKRGLSQSSSQPRSSQPQPPSQIIASSEEIRSFETLNFRSDTEKERWQTSFKRVKEVGLDKEREEIDPIGHEDDQPIGDAMMEEAPEAPVEEDVTIKMVNEDDDEDDDDNDDDYDDSNKYIVSVTPPARKLIIFYVNSVLA
ncbi:hypothetical protein F3Y22_tig00112289pilonHSYRG00295 [Hibiscus syriacus]|uniref:Aminotransferase-like plant mobile domain-containing protein n=1 Tax=Hibiscus syriacus TaxID=106335 RepID=A0A6A2Y0M3_HIBSY|nr:hypothetical protein F3Y22_tig00112289pilonHSYRG00295 [Hibiscus syriacus]